MRRQALLLACAVLTLIAGADANGYKRPPAGGGRIDLSTQAAFSMNGIEGMIHFYQAADDPNEPVVITVELEGLDQFREDYSWHVHDYPVNFGLLHNFPCSQSEVGGHYDPTGAAVNNPDYNDDCAADKDACEIGDLAGKLGKIRWDETEQQFEDTRLSLFGPQSIVGRSIVMHRSDGSRLACANIKLHGKGLKSWRYPFIPVRNESGDIVIPNALEGDVIFRRVQGRDELFIDVDLYRVDGEPSPTSGHKWSLRRGTCDNLGAVYGTMTYEDEYERERIRVGCTLHQRLCFQGDLSAKCGTLDVNDANRIKSFCADDQLGTTRQTDLMSLVLVVHDADDSDVILGCSERVPIVPQAGYAYILTRKLFAHLAFYQADPHDKTFVRAFVIGLNGQAGYFQIHEMAVPEDGNCSAVGEIYDKPGTSIYNAGISSGIGAIETDNLGPIGRLEHKFSDFEGLTSFRATESTSFLPLFPPFSIIGRSLVLYNEDDEIWGCSTIERFSVIPPGLASITGYA